MTPGVYDGYLRRLGFPRPPEPTVEALFALQRAHLERIPYENLDIQLGRPPGIDPELSARRFAAGRGGYCFHLNGAFALLLETLGFEVTRHLAGVLGASERERRDVSGDHLALTVRVGAEEYFVDAGLGDGPYEPLPLRAGMHRQGSSRTGWARWRGTQAAGGTSTRRAPARRSTSSRRRRRRPISRPRTYGCRPSRTPASYGPSRCCGATRTGSTRCGGGC